MTRTNSEKPSTPSPRSPWWHGRRGEWYVALQGVLILVTIAGPWIAPASDIPLSSSIEALRIIGAMAITLGALIAIAGALSLGKNLTPLPHPIDSATLVEGGAYRLVRHPIYSGLCLAAIGWALWCNSAVTLLTAAVLFVFFDIKSRREERWLVARFTGYTDYRRRVKKLIPFVY
jgi:protein-S-isoprenylcysteine O-methyltransferase Ste14